jgi:endonuclease/exonuclease/phosphatase family metal-dependent hydrolase
MFWRGFAMLLALDRIWVHPAAAVVSQWVHRSPLSRRASDHLPLGAVLTMQTGKEAVA